MSHSPDSEPSQGMLSFPILLAVAGITSAATASIFLVGNPAGEALPGISETIATSEEEPRTDSTTEKPAIDSASTEDAVGPDEPATEQIDAEVARTVKLLVGSWTRESYGTRTLTIHEDGTAKMVIKPSSVYAFVFGPVINIDVKWELQEGFVDYKVTGGTPTDKVKLAKDTWGDHWHEKIDKLDETTLVLQGEEGDKYEWTRIEAPEPSSDEI